ncbi:hypothetical protein V2J09_005497 [Rumex salicifolius]
MSRKENKDLNPLLLKFGAALVVSFAGFLFARLRSKSIGPSLPPPPPSPSDGNNQVHSRNESSEDVHTTPRTPISEAKDKPFLRVRIDNGSSNSSPSTRSSDRERFLLPEFNELIKAFDISAVMLQESVTPVSTEIAPRGTHNVERSEYEHEVQKLKAMVMDLKERERSLEMQLLEYYGIKEQETTVMELQNRLKINNVEAKIFSLKIEGLKGENKRLKAQVADYTEVATELEDAKAKIKELKRKLRSDAEERKEQILRLKNRVLMMKLQEQDPHMAGISETVEPEFMESLQRLQDLENEREELMKSKYELQRENSELARRLESTQIIANSMLEDPEVGELHNEVVRLREENENLSNEVERLQSDRCADAEALVYLRWVNACLRYELRNYQPPPGKTVARDLSKTLSPRSEEKAKRLILEYANSTEERGANVVVDFEYDQWSSSQSYQTDNGDHHDEVSFDTLSTGNKAHNSKKVKFFDKLRRLITGKDKDDQTSKKESALLKSQSVDDFGKVYSYVGPRRNSVSIPSSTEADCFTSLSGEDGMIRMNRSSSASSSQSCKRFVIGKVSPLEKGMEVKGREPDLARYAEALKDSPWSKKIHRKSASYSAF